MVCKKGRRGVSRRKGEGMLLWAATSACDNTLDACQFVSSPVTV